jgi:hypothetical protein
LITTGQVTGHRAGSPITGREATTAAKMAVALDDDLDDDLGGPADETVRSGIGGTGYAIDPGHRGRIPASIVQRYHAATGGR